MDTECLLCGAPGGFPYCDDACMAADQPDETFYGLHVTELGGIDQPAGLIAVGPDLSERRALAAFAAYTRHHDPAGAAWFRELLAGPNGPRVAITANSAAAVLNY